MRSGVFLGMSSIRYSIRYSIIVAVYNRPDEMDELLESLSRQTLRNFEVVVVEDGSQQPSKTVCDRYAGQLEISYFAKENSGPGLSRNYGCDRARGEVFLFLDSDCTVPPTWLEVVDHGLHTTGFDAFGGPDREHDAFSPLQKAISYAMTSVLTTGGIRGSKIRVGGAFHPRSFNMGMRREVYTTTHGFSTMRFGEDIDFSIRMVKAGFQVGLLPEAWVYHKRRTDLKKFFKQVHNSGMARINLTLRHPGTLKLTHFFPAAFTVYVAVALLYLVIHPLGVWALLPLAVWGAAIALHASLRMRSASIGVLAVLASMVQMIGYGTGFIRGLVRRVILNKPEGYAYQNTFYK
jgi:glycosyltransferase involved in cell wall biosynthesis